MALRGGMRAIRRRPAWLSRDIRSRLLNSASGTSSRITPRIVAEPRNWVSLAPRMRSSRSVNTWPRSGSVQSWISSTATKSAPLRSGIASTVQTR